MSDARLKYQTVVFEERLRAGATTTDLLIPAFATVREASARLLDMRHFPTQLIGGMALHDGNIAEMPTGQGKTLVATLPAYLNALTGKGVYIITVNDYLARRDAKQMGQIYNFLGLSVGLVTSGMSAGQRRHAYQCDITYGTASEFGFDYLRDNMAETATLQVQRERHYAIIDEVDAILIDEARTPLIISKPCDKSTLRYGQANCFVGCLCKEDIEVDRKEKMVTLTETGIAKAEKFFHVSNLADISQIALMHAIHQALYAHVILKRDTDYMVKNGEILIVDTFTGRPMPGRRFSDGLHQAIEAKEHVRINAESKTMATITLQNYFRLFDKIAGMTGTAETEAEEFREIYHLNTIAVPPNKPIIRKDLRDQVFMTEKAKIDAVVKAIKTRHQNGQPVLIGTVSVEKSEALSRRLSQEGIAHNVLNAKHLEQEAAIIALAGQKNAVTIATNMAGRGTDIKLGKGVAALGGLHIIGTERHESRRIDNQLRGRAGRQGDPGSSQFYVSLEDDLIKHFAPQRVQKVAESLGLPKDAPLDSRFIDKSIAAAQRKIEAIHFDERKNVLKYDLIVNKQRTLIYKQRQMILDGKDISRQIAALAKKPSQVRRLRALHNFLDDETFDNLARQILLKNVDFEWENHIDDMAYLRQGIGLRAYGQNDPVIEYMRESADLFNAMSARIQENTLQYLCSF